MTVQLYALVTSKDMGHALADDAEECGYALIALADGVREDEVEDFAIDVAEAILDEDRRLQVVTLLRAIADAVAEG